MRAIAEESEWIAASLPSAMPIEVEGAHRRL